MISFYLAKIMKDEGKVKLAGTFPKFIYYSPNITDNLEMLKAISFDYIRVSFGKMEYNRRIRFKVGPMHC